MSEASLEPLAYGPKSERRGHVESYFVKLNSPDGARALWLKWTLMVPRGGEARAEAWAIAFRRGGPQRAVKRSQPLAQAGMVHAGVGALDFAGARFDGTRAAGALASAGCMIAWDLALEPRVGPLRQFPFEWMYRGPLPETKFTSPVPDAVARGSFTVDGETVDVTGWRAMHGHNWGTRQAHRYVWIHAAGFREDEAAVFESISARLFKGGVELPWLSAFYLYDAGAWQRFDRPAAMVRTRVRAGVMFYDFECTQGEHTLRGEARAARGDTVGLHYVNPAAPVTYCLNTKLADLTLTLASPAGSRTLHTDRAALEVGWPSADHGITMLA